MMVNNLTATTATTAKNSPPLSKTNTVHDDKPANLGEKNCAAIETPLKETANLFIFFTSPNKTNKKKY
jgi:hypothetical protein